MAYNEYLATGQNNYTFPQTFNAGGRFPIIAKSIWETLADLQGYIDDWEGSNAHVGQIVSVIGDGDNNGVYRVESIATAEGESGTLEKVGSGAGSTSVEYYYEALELATASNLGQVIYVTEDWIDADGTYGDAGEEYDAGPYIVNGDGSVAKLGTTSASGDLDSSVTTLEGKVSTLESTVIDIQDDISDIEGQLSDLEDEIGNLDLGDENIIESITFNGTTATITDKTAAITYTAPEYTLKSITAGDGMASSYQLTKDGTAVGDTINIPLDQVLDSAEIKTVTDVDTPYDGAAVGDKYIEFLFQNSDPQYLPVQDLVDVYTGSEYIDIDSSNEISLDYTNLLANLTTDLESDLDVVKSVDTEASNHISLTYTTTDNVNKVGINVDIDSLKATILDGVEGTDTTYTAADGGGLTLTDTAFSVDVASLTVSLVEDDTTSGGVGAALSDLQGQIGEVVKSVDTEASNHISLTYTTTDNVNKVGINVDIDSLKATILDGVEGTDTTYTAADGGGLTLTDTAFSVDVASLTVSLVEDDTTSGGVGAALSDLQGQIGDIESILSWGSIV